MFDFLPIEYKNKLIKIYRKKIMVFWLFALSVIFLWAIILSIPFVFSTYVGRQDVLREKQSVELNLDIKHVESIEKRVKEVEFLANILKSNIENQSIVSIIEKIISVKFQGITIKSINIIRPENLSEFGIIGIEGIAKTREDLVYLSNELEKEKTFLKIDLPVSDFAKSIDAPFSIKIEAKI